MPVVLPRLAILAALIVSARPASAQRTDAPPPPAGAVCEYATCALAIAPVWNGLAVVQGTTQRPVATLGFFVPHRMDAAFDGDSARAYAVRAFQVRRAAAAFTDAGALLLAAGAVRTLGAHRVDPTGRALLAAGACAFTIGVPLQFSADGLLSRAVWWHNARFGR